MADHFSDAEWGQINAHLDSDPARYGLPERRAGSIVLMSWNIRKFGAFEENGTKKKSAGAFTLIEKVCASADLIAVQQVQRAFTRCRTDCALLARLGTSSLVTSPVWRRAIREWRSVMRFCIAAIESGAVIWFPTCHLIVLKLLKTATKLQNK